MAEQHDDASCSVPRRGLDLTGQRFGQLIVLGRWRADPHGKLEWLCRCTCAAATERWIASVNLRSGQTKSCGCARRQHHHDLTGQHFGRLIVLGPWRAGHHYGHEWLCRCTCAAATECWVVAAQLRAGKVKSCGCLRRDVSLEIWSPGGSRFHERTGNAAKWDQQVAHKKPSHARRFLRHCVRLQEHQHADAGLDPEAALLAAERRAAVHQALAQLPPRLATVLRGRFGCDGRTPQTLQTLGTELGITRERARQNEKQGLRLMRCRLRHLNDAAALPPPAVAGPHRNQAPCRP